MRKTIQIRVLCTLLNCDASELTKYSKNVYEWRGVYFEVTGSKSMTAPASHYSIIMEGNTTLAVRELGDKSKIMKELKNA